MPLHPISRSRLLALLLLLSLALPLGATRRTIHLSTLGLRAGTKENSTPLLRKLLEGLQSELEQGAGSIRIVENTFRTFDTPLLHTISTDGILWRDNRIEPTRSYPKFHPNQKRFLFEGCRNIDIAPSDTIQQFALPYI